MKQFFLAIVALSLLVACAEKQDRVVNEQFSETLPLSAVEYPVEEILKPIDMVVLDDYLVIQNEFLSDADCFFVYSRDSLRFLYSFGRRGQGPDDFMAPALVQNPIGNTLAVFDQSTFKLAECRLDKEAASREREWKVPAGDRMPLQEIYYCSDSVLIYNTLETCNLHTGQVVDKVAIRSNLAELMGDNFNKSLDGFHFACEGGRLMVAFHYINRVLWGGVDGAGRIDMPETDLHLDGPLNASLDDNLLYYMYVAMAPDLCIAQYAGYSFLSMQPFPVNMGKRRFDMLLEAYTPDGQPLALLDLQHDLLRCKIDSRHKRILMWNILEDFDRLYVYDYSSVLAGRE